MLLGTSTSDLFLSFTRDTILTMLQTVHVCLILGKLYEKDTVWKILRPSFGFLSWNLEEHNLIECIPFIRSSYLLYFPSTCLLSSHICKSCYVLRSLHDRASIGTLMLAVARLQDNVVISYPSRISGASTLGVYGEGDCALTAGPGSPRNTHQGVGSRQWARSKCQSMQHSEHNAKTTKYLNGDRTKCPSRSQSHWPHQYKNNVHKYNSILTLDSEVLASSF